MNGLNQFGTGFANCFASVQQARLNCAQASHRDMDGTGRAMERVGLQNPQRTLQTQQYSISSPRGMQVLDLLAYRIIALGGVCNGRSLGPCENRSAAINME